MKTDTLRKLLVELTPEQAAQINGGKHGADDPAGDDRGGRGRGADDPVGHA